MLVDVAHPRVVGAEPRLAALVDPLVRVEVVVEQSVDLRDHVPGDQVPAPARVLAVRPVVDEADDAPEAASQLHHVVDLRDQVVRGANDRGTLVRECDIVHRLVRRFVDRALACGEGADSVLVVVSHQAVARLLSGLLASLSDVPVHHDAPVLAIDLIAVLGRRFLCEAPLGRERAHPGFGHGADGEHSGLMLACQRHAGRREDRCDGELHLLLERLELEPGVAQREPLGLVGEALVGLEQPPDDPHRLVLPVSQYHRVHAQRVSVRRQRARPRPEDHATTRLVIELHESLRHHERMVVRQRDDAGAEHNPVGAFGSRRKEDLWRGDHLPSRRVVLTAPELVVSEVVHKLDQLEVALKLKRGVFAYRMMRRKKRAKAQGWHGLPLKVAGIGLAEAYSNGVERCASDYKTQHQC